MVVKISIYLHRRVFVMLAFDHIVQNDGAGNCVFFFGFFFFFFVFLFFFGLLLMESLSWCLGVIVRIF